MRDPSTLFFQQNGLRRTIIFCYWFVVLLALPLWWSTTSIERLPLPSGRVSEQQGKNLDFPIQICSHDFDLTQHLKSANIRLRATCEGTKETTYFVARGPVAISADRHLSIPSLDSAAVHLLASLLVIDVTREQHVVPFAPRYQLAFTLLNEDAAAGPAITSWDLSSAISRYLQPLLDDLSLLHNFTIESQVQYHAPLAFSPTPLESGWGLTAEHLTIFVNSAEWTLASGVSNDPVLHFVLFVPSATRRPLHVLDSDTSERAAFLVPQWGGITIFNPDPKLAMHQHLGVDDLGPVFATFTYQLATLLGVPPLPASAQRQLSCLTMWQRDALLRYRALTNANGARDILHSIITLVDQIANMPVGTEVRADLVHALDELDTTFSSTSLEDVYRASSHAITLASRAFFNPNMLAMLYFPPEHTYAVYTPLFASALIPLVATAIREFWAWRKSRKEGVLRAYGS
ncbi:hypothetical protein FISHEDRAFT_66127 [Fistulina hepatica ATCC 64428]|uniref:GPI transamidase component PIG-S n=1 Tax=Fistulina hepatica ATCC 64428 TaxID=1128425 RepID=A0A0D7ABX0_9AGAR|nr:hypothetical protein FISHEDRAFT_66127 [Fistulina hepatica ATCC 64428]